MRDVPVRAGVRQEDRARTVAFSDGLARVTSNDTAALRPLRSMGLIAMDRMPALQAYLVLAPNEASQMEASAQVLPAPSEAVLPARAR